MFSNIESSSYFQVVLFVGFLAGYYYYQQKLPGFRLISLALARMVILVLVFSYFSLTWSSAVNPSLRTTSVFGMFLVNLYLLWQVILTRAELPYRLALESSPKEADKTASVHKIIHTGRRYYYLRHFWQALFSGGFPRAYLRDLAADRIRQDLKGLLHRQGVDKELITCQTLTAYLRNNLDADETLPEEFKEIIHQAIAAFSGHPWIEEQVNQFLVKVMEAPEEFYTGEGTQLLK